MRGHDGVFVAKNCLYTPSIETCHANRLEVTTNVIEDVMKIAGSLKVSPACKGVHKLRQLKTRSKLLEIARHKGLAGLSKQMLGNIFRSFGH
ncbi:MAG: hypothetical protein AAF557_18485 [Pseudomonadota bacterium]